MGNPTRRRKKCCAPVWVHKTVAHGNRTGSLRRSLKSNRTLKTFIKKPCNQADSRRHSPKPWKPNRFLKTPPTKQQAAGGRSSSRSSKSSRSSSRSRSSSSSMQYECLGCRGSWLLGLYHCVRVNQGGGQTDGRTDVRRPRRTSCFFTD